jgi:exodeoxyribonuclease VII large subunit
METNYHTITEVNNYIKLILDSNKNLNLIYLKGEISNFKNHTRGHLYFTLKDENSRLSAVMFASSARNLNFNPNDGDNVLVRGRISAYPASGNYQIYVDDMQLDGLGNLYIEFEKLKKKLFQEGLFADEHKKQIPKYPEKIGVITASTGAAVRDIMSTIRRRYPLCEVILFPSLVQGNEAAANIVRQIEEADKYDLDLLIVGRGGGSIEDLWAFNEEIVARAIYNANTPIISAVGHEPDFTIADFVADLRAPTPTGAAEMAVPTVIDTNAYINQLKLRLDNSIKTLINNLYIMLRNYQNSFVLKNPMSLYETKEQKLDQLIDNLKHNMENILNSKKHSLEIVQGKVKLITPYSLIQNNQAILNERTLTLNNIIDKKLLEANHNLEYLINSLKLVNPLNILSKGYSLVKHDDVLINNSDDINIGDEISIKLYKGEIKGIVKEIKNERENV